MLVIHSKDKSTSLAEAIYANMPNVHVVEDEWYERGIGQLLWQTPKEEPILIIGYGDCHGLYRERFNDVLEISPSDFDDLEWVHRLANCQIGVPQIVLNRIHAYNLRRHNGNIIGIWPNAVEFARRNHLHGLFASTFFFNAKDAENYGEITLDMYIERSNILSTALLANCWLVMSRYTRFPKNCSKEPIRTHVSTIATFHLKSKQS